MASTGQGPVGYVDLHGEGRACRELGYAVAPSALWGRGLGTAIARAGVRYGFECLGLAWIWAEALERNAASVRVLQKLGMRYTSTAALDTYLGEPSRYVRYRLDRSPASVPD